MGGGRGDWETSLCQAGEAISALGECNLPNRGGRAHGGGASGQVERQEAREGFFQLRAAGAHLKSAGRRAVEGEVLLGWSTERSMN